MECFGQIPTPEDYRDSVQAIKSASLTSHTHCYFLIVAPSLLLHSSY
jgi:hypothetical protein